MVFKGDPFTPEAFDAVPEMRSSLDDLGPGLSALVGGGSAIQYDFDQAIESDLKLIVPIALLVIAIILAILLRALVAPLVLIASVVLSFLCTLGLSILFIRFVVGDAGLDASIPTFAFIFLVALGIDYTIFLMARVREEARTHGTREGMLRALTATGPVITSAGVILAGTFSVLMTLPVTFTFDLGFMVALGILLGHVHRADDHGPGRGRADRRQDLVALDRDRGSGARTRTRASTPRCLPKETVREAGVTGSRAVSSRG